MTDVHLINHTHWDREWFLTHEYTTAWVPALIDSLEKLAADNPDYDFLFDGQTLAIEDLLSIAPDYESRVRDLVTAGQLHIGPCYSQPDWRMVSGELHVRNLQYGMSDAARFGATPQAAWLVDTFGHISQAPQLLAQAGLEAAYVWRGVPEMAPLFRWTSPDGTSLGTIDLFGGYRNLYGITKTPEIAVERLVAETGKLEGSYAGLPIPLFDGYDLDTEPEDPYRWYANLEIPDDIRLHQSSPEIYAAAMAEHVATAPQIEGELLSGKYGSTFPGTLSARTYLKVMHHDAERALHRVIEPLAAMAGSRSTVASDVLERASRTLLQNGVHDCLCGVSIDQVHERMERSYGELLAWADDAQRELATQVLSGFAPGTYALSSNTMPVAGVVRTGDSAVRVATTGVGVTQIAETGRLETVETVDEHVDRFEWSNGHYRASIDSRGIHVEGSGTIARLVVRADAGDTYSSEPGDVIGELEMVDDPVVVDRSMFDTRVATTWRLADGASGISVDAEVIARFDDGPVIDLAVRLDSTGTGFRVDADFETRIASSSVTAGMPFDLVERGHDGDDLFGLTIDPAMAAILMGQRETEYVTEFPFHDVVAMSDGSSTRAVFAQGLRSYRSRADGTLSVALRRSAEWLALSGLQYRIGDAGPAMYVPGARCERVVEHRLGFVVASGSPRSAELLAASTLFQNPPIIADVADSPVDGPTSLHLFEAPAPNSAIVATHTSMSDDADPSGSTDAGDGAGASRNGAIAVRLYNPTRAAVALGRDIEQTGFRGADSRTASELAAGQIATTTVASPALPEHDPAATVSVRGAIASRVGPSRTVPAPDELTKLEARIVDLEAELAANAERRAAATDGPDRYRLTHREYVLDRERLELTLSLVLNRRRAACDELVSIPDDPDPEIAAIGAELNDLRVKRRIWDYVVQALALAS